MFSAKLKKLLHCDFLIMRLNRPCNYVISSLFLIILNYKNPCNIFAWDCFLSYICGVMIKSKYNEKSRPLQIERS